MPYGLFEHHRLITLPALMLCTRTLSDSVPTMWCYYGLITFSATASSPRSKLEVHKLSTSVESAVLLKFLFPEGKPI